MRFGHLVVAVALAGILAVSAPARPGGAIDHGKGHAGFCRDANGVTVVIDFQQLGGTTIVRCNPQSGRGTGLDALVGAGIQIAGVQRWGESFICRIENRPSPTETIPVDGQSGYREACVDTPPANAYWSYWHAGNNCAWTYSQWGVKNRDFIPGGFEGWSFSLNATADANPVPRIAPVRPGTEGGRCTDGREPGPSTGDPGEHLDRSPTSAAGPSGSASPDRPGSRTPAARSGSASAPAGSVQDPAGAGGVGADPEGTSQSTAPDRARRTTAAPAGADPDSPDAGTARTADARQVGVDPAANVPFTGGAGAPDLRADTGGGALTPWITLGLIVVLAGVAGWVEGRRRRRRAG